MKDLSLSFSLLGSSLLHVLILLLISAVVASRSGLTPPDLISVSVLELAPAEKATASHKEEKPPVQQKPAPAHRTDNTDKAEAKHKGIERERPSPPPMTAVRQEQDVEANPPLPAPAEQIPVPPPNSKVEGGGSEAGAGGLLAEGKVAVGSGNGLGPGGGGTAIAGLGSGAGAPGLPAPTPLFKSNREAKPIRTARATYPPMALRMGVEGDVTLRVEIGSDGRVTRAEIIKGAGMGFDEEALKAVKQSRFEPAQKDGKNVPAEFTYIYRFRLGK